MRNICGCVDPFNDSNFYIFGSKNNNNCYFYNDQTKKYCKIKSIPMLSMQQIIIESQFSVWGHRCTVIAQQTMQNNNQFKYYAVILGHRRLKYFQIYDFNLNKWNDYVKNNFQNIAGHLNSARGYGFCAITDINVKNKIHIGGGNWGIGDQSCKQYVNVTIDLGVYVCFLICYFDCAISQ